MLEEIKVVLWLMDEERKGGNNEAGESLGKGSEEGMSIKVLAFLSFKPEVPPIFSNK